MGIARDDRKARDAAVRRNCEAFGAPVIGFVLIHKGFMPFAALDAGIMLQTLFLSAKAHGARLLPPGGPGHLASTLRRRVRGAVGLPPHHGLRPGLRLRGPRQRLPGRAAPVRLVTARS